MHYICSEYKYRKYSVHLYSKQKFKAMEEKKGILSAIAETLRQYELNQSDDKDSQAIALEEKLEEIAKMISSLSDRVDNLSSRVNNIGEKVDSLAAAPVFDAKEEIAEEEVTHTVEPVFDVHNPEDVDNTFHLMEDEFEPEFEEDGETTEKAHCYSQAENDAQDTQAEENVNEEVMEAEDDIINSENGNPNEVEIDDADDEEDEEDEEDDDEVEVADEDEGVDEVEVADEADEAEGVDEVEVADDADETDEVEEAEETDGMLPDKSDDEDDTEDAGRDFEVAEEGIAEETIAENKAEGKRDWYDWEYDYPAEYVDDIMGCMGINDKLEFVRELFHSDPMLFDSQMKEIDTMPNFKAIVQFFRMAHPEWDESSDTVYRLYMYIRRKFRK